MKKTEFTANIEIQEYQQVQKITDLETIQAIQQTSPTETLVEERDILLAGEIGETVEYSVPTVIKIEPLATDSLANASYAYGQAFKVTTGISHIPVAADFSSNSGGVTTICGLQFHFAAPLATGTKMELFLPTGTKLIENTLAAPVTLSGFPIHDPYQTPEVKYYELYSEFILVLSNPGGRLSTVATPGGVGMIIVANIGGGGIGTSRGYPIGTPFVPVYMPGDDGFKTKEALKQDFKIAFDPK